MVMINKEGEIAFSGNPGSRKILEDIETLLKGKKLTNISEDENNAEKFEELDSVKIDSEFQSSSEKLKILVNQQEIKT